MTSVKPRAKELARSITADTYRDAYRRGQSLSVYLETLDPSTQYNDGLDAFERMLMVSGIVTRGSRELGIQATTYDEFLERGRSLIPEYMRREYMKAAKGERVSTRGVFTSEEDMGTAASPYATAAEMRATTHVSPAIPLSELVALDTGIDNGTYTAFYLDTDNQDELRMKRTTEAAEVPSMTLTGGDHTIKLQKFGRSLSATYEQLRRMQLDKLSFLIQMMAIRAEADKVSAAIDVLINGDGNSNAATTYNLTTLDTSTAAGTLTLKGWLAFKMKFTNPYAMTVAIAQEDVALQMVLLNTGSANVPLVSVSGIGGFTSINQGLADNVRLGWTSGAPALKILGIDTRVALERIYEVGANISEIERFTTNQTQSLTITEVEGFAVMDNSGAKVLDVNA